MTAGNGKELENVLDWVEGVRRKVRELVEEWKDREGNLIMILHAIQDEFGYVPRGVANELAKELGVNLARIYEVITFYHYFRLKPPGQHHIQVCTGTACYLRGASRLYAELEQEIELLEKTGARKGEFLLETVRCIGCCGMAPAVVVDKETHGCLAPPEMAGLLKGKRKG